MKELEIAYRILSDIEENGIAFHDAIGNYFREDSASQPYRSLVTNLVGTALRHKYLFDHNLHYFEKLTKEDKRLIALVMANHYYTKRLDANEVLAYLSAQIGEEKAILIRDSVLTKEREDLLKGIKPFENRYITLNFNCPSWVYQTIRNTITSGKAYRSLRDLTRQAKPTIRVRNSHLKEAIVEQLATSDSYEKTSVEGILRYVGKSPLRSREEWKYNNIFPEKIGTKYVIDQIEFKPTDHVFMYCENDDCSPLRELIERNMSNVAMYLGVHNTDEHSEVRRMVRRDKLTNISFFGAEHDSLAAYIPEKQDVVFALPKSTGFDLIPTSPDYLLRLKESDVKGLIENQTALLEHLSEYVGEEGKLVYMVYTINAKEGQNQIKAFLEKHPEYYLLKEEQLIPCDKKFETALYYAIMVKGEKPQWLIDQEETKKALLSVEEKEEESSASMTEAKEPSSEQASEGE